MPLDDDGSEIMDDTPVALPVRFKRVNNEYERFREIIRQELSRQADNAGWESFEDSDDFDCDDDFDPQSPYEMEFEGYADPRDDFSPARTARAAGDAGKEGQSGILGQGPGATQGAEGNSAGEGSTSEGPPISSGGGKKGK